jgi:hypothetical protein
LLRDLVLVLQRLAGYRATLLLPSSRFRLGIVPRRPTQLWEEYRPGDAREN